MMEKSTKRAFTIVELVIVIAVIAILAAVLIPTFSTIIGQANDARAESELREIKIKIESIFAEENSTSFTAEVGREVQIGRNTDGSLWQTNATDLADALNSWPELYAFGSFTVSGKDLIYTTKSGAGKSTWSNIVGEKQGVPIIDGLEFTPYDSGEWFLVTGIGAYINEKNIVIPSVFQGKPVTGIGDEAFAECESIESVKISDGITSIGSSSFAGCLSLESVVIPEGVTSLGDGAFIVCTSLTSIDLPESLTSISSSAFAGCLSLESIVIPEGVTNIGDYAFGACSSLTSIKLPKNLTSISSGAFYQCTSLTNINIPEGIASIDEYTFYDCSSLASINLPESLTHIGGDAFTGCTDLKTITYSGTTTQWADIEKVYGWNSITGHYTIVCTDGEIS